MLTITTLEKIRRVKAGLLEVLKITNGLGSIFPADFLLWKMSMAKQVGTLIK